MLSLNLSNSTPQGDGNCDPCFLKVLVSDLSNSTPQGDGNHRQGIHTSR